MLLVRTALPMNFPSPVTFLIVVNTNNDYFLELNILKIFPLDFLDFLGTKTMQLNNKKSLSWFQEYPRNPKGKP